MSSLKHPSPGSEESEAKKLYFSYGSNMHLQQMAARCHDSTLFAKGILRSYKWQINSRGGANVIEGNREDFVEGIVFTVSPSDVRALRHYEGVKQQFYAEREFDIEVERITDTALEGRKPADVARTLALYNSESSLTEAKSSADAAIPEQDHINSNSTAGDTHLQISRECSTTSQEPASVHQNDQKSERISHYDTPSKNNPGEKEFRKALIYISYEHQLPGDIREEYIARMQLAMADARMLGVSQNYLETSLHPLVFGKRTGTRPDEIRSLLQKPAPRAPSPDTSLNDEQ